MAAHVDDAVTCCALLRNVEEAELGVEGAGCNVAGGHLDVHPVAADVLERQERAEQGAARQADVSLVGGAQRHHQAGRVLLVYHLGHRRLVSVETGDQPLKATRK